VQLQRLDGEETWATLPARLEVHLGRPPGVFAVTTTA
jgi:hypothetical protein